MTCDRCGKETRVSSMSYFNTDTCCLDCLRAERDHPAYEAAKKAEGEAVLRGDYNFRGVGAPPDLGPRHG